MILTIILAASLAAQPNIFEPNELSSEVIFATVAICTDKAVQNGSKDEDAVVMCACLMDAIRFNTKKGLRPPQNNATPEQQEKCKASSTKRRGDAKPKKGKIGV